MEGKRSIPYDTLEEGEGGGGGGGRRRREEAKGGKVI